MKDIYVGQLSIFKKIVVGLNNNLNTASVLDAGFHNHVSVHGGEYLGDVAHQAGLDAMGMSTLD